MAAGYLRDRLVREAGATNPIGVESAGLLGINGAPATAHACQVLEEHGIDLSTHRSRGLRRDELESADLVLVMTAAQRDAVQALGGWPRKRIELLRAYESGTPPALDAPDLEDPIGSSLEAYRECFLVIRRCVDNFLRSLQDRS